MKPISLVFGAAFWLAAVPSYGQQSVRDTSIFMVPVTLSYAYQLPGGNMADRFGANNSLGLSAFAKLPNNFFLGGEGAFIFGNQVIEPGLGDGLQNSYGQILDQEGQPATVLVFQRGYSLLASVGKIMPIVGPNPNSGLMLKLSGGYLRHKIRIETQNNEVPQLQDDYLEGYDRLTGGPAAQLEIGYLHIGNNRFANFFVALHSLFGFTSSLRAVNFDTGQADQEDRLDMLTGLRAGWTLPIYRRKADSFYIY
ncbi:MAG: hypothetical protein KDB88_07405 [Flavobacteriales bacterium]|nr:hypothetical protein [Flavobacteriales bacterium]